MRLAGLALVVVALVVQASTTAVSKAVADNQHVRAVRVDTRGRLLIIVRDSLTSAPLGGALVRVPGTRWGALTDETGRGVILGITPGILEVRVSAESHLPSIDTVVVKSGGYDTLRVLLRSGLYRDTPDFEGLFGVRGKADSVASSVAKPTRVVAESASATPRNPKQHN